MIVSDTIAQFMPKYQQDRQFFSPNHIGVQIDASLSVKQPYH